MECEDFTLVSQSHGDSAFHLASKRHETTKQACALIRALSRSRLCGWPMASERRSLGSLAACLHPQRGQACCDSESSVTQMGMHVHGVSAGTNASSSLRTVASSHPSTWRTHRDIPTGHTPGQPVREGSRGGTKPPAFSAYTAPTDLAVGAGCSPRVEGGD
eukprot:17933-Chlamydomonas_euryale.AAC.3